MKARQLDSQGERSFVLVFDSGDEVIRELTAFATRERLAGIMTRLVATGTPAPLAESKALMVLNGQVTRQAMMLSFEQLFLLFGACFVLSLPLLLLMHKSKGMPGGAAAH